jgi:hypothetical protein
LSGKGRFKPEVSQVPIEIRTAIYPKFGDCPFFSEVFMQQKARIRPIVLGLIQNNDRLFVFEDIDPATQKKFYRALGGGVEFGETSLEALQREFHEEIQAELTNIEYLGCLENRFMFNGNSKHEWVQLYRCEFADPKFYQLEPIHFQDGSPSSLVASWVECDRFLSGELRLVPESFLAYL